jgi:hypothetical protein
MRRAIVPGVLAFVVVGGAAFAQSFNIDIGPADDCPAQDYAAGGWSGFWNCVRLEHTSPSPSPQPFDYFLRDVNGIPTNVRVHQYGAMEELSANDPTVGGNDARLLNDAVVTHSIPLKACLFFNNLPNGAYEVLTYAWMPNHPSTDQVVFHDFTPGVALVGGAWTGQHEEGVTYARHIVQVTNGFMGPHAGIPDFGDPIIGGALNGIQLHKIGGPGDWDDDDDVDLADHRRFAACMTDPGAEGIAPGCSEYDIDHDNDVDMVDFESFELLFTGP